MPRPGAMLLPILLVALLPVAAAHADLAGADPAPNANVPAGREEVRVRFTEAVDPDATTIVVFETNAPDAPANAGDLRFSDDRREVVAPVAPLQDGVYTVRWRALSTSDGHTTRGAFLFAVGSASLGPGAPGPATYDESDYDPASVAREAIPRTVYFAGLMLGLGVPVFGLVVLRGEPLSNRLLGTAGAFALVGGLAGLVTVALLARSLDFGFWRAADTVAGGLFLRRALLLGAAGLVLLAALALPPGRRRPAAAAAALAALAALVTTSLGSHAAGVRDNAWLAIASDALHLLMGAVWIGGVVAFLHVGRGRDARDLARLVTRFTPLALGSVVLLLATGIYAGLLHLHGEVAALWRDQYGRLVAAKALLMLPLVMLGAYNSRWLRPRLEDGRAPARLFRRAVQLEVLVMAVVLLLAGALASSAPPSRPGGGGGLDGATPPGEAAAFELDQTTRTAHVVLQIRPDPPIVGPSNVTVTVHAAELPAGTQVYAVFEPPDLEAGEEGQLVLLKRVGDATWTKEGTYFTSPGAWTLHVTIQRGAGHDPDRATFEIPVSAAGGAAT